MKTCVFLTFVWLAWTGWVDHEVHGSPFSQDEYPLEVTSEPAEETSLATPAPEVDTTHIPKCSDLCLGSNAFIPHGNKCICIDPDKVVDANTNK